MSDIQAFSQFVYMQRTASRTALSRFFFVILMIDPPKTKGCALYQLSYPTRTPLLGVGVRAGFGPATSHPMAPLREVTDANPCGLPPMATGLFPLGDDSVAWLFSFFKLFSQAFVSQAFAGIDCPLPFYLIINNAILVTEIVIFEIGGPISYVVAIRRCAVNPFIHELIAFDELIMPRILFVGRGPIDDFAVAI